MSEDNPQSSKYDLSLRAPAKPPGVFFDHLLDKDRRPVPACLRLHAPLQGGPTDVSIDRYLTQSWHDLEVKKLWGRVWQMACREEEIPNVGDTYLYEVAHLKFIVVRVSSDQIKAYPNACLHRARQLVDYPGRKGQFRCPYHGFTWDLDGALAK